eukprot:PhM_4_TR14021/c0_g2_i1/m.16095
MIMIMLMLFVFICRWPRLERIFEHSQPLEGTLGLRRDERPPKKRLLGLRDKTRIEALADRRRTVAAEGLPDEHNLLRRRLVRQRAREATVVRGRRGGESSPAAAVREAEHVARVVPLRVAAETRRRRHPHVPFGAQDCAEVCVAALLAGAQRGIDGRTGCVVFFRALVLITSSTVLVLLAVRLGLLQKEVRGDEVVETLRVEGALGAVHEGVNGVGDGLGRVRGTAVDVGHPGAVAQRIGLGEVVREQKTLQINDGVLCAQNMCVWVEHLDERDGLLHAGAIDEIALVHNDNVGELNLVDEQVRDVAFVLLRHTTRRRCRFSGGPKPLRDALHGEQVLGEGRGVDDGHTVVETAQRVQRGLVAVVELCEEGLGRFERIGHAG